MFRHGYWGELTDSLTQKLLFTYRSCNSDVNYCDGVCSMLVVLVDTCAWEVLMRSSLCCAIAATVLQVPVDLASW